MAGHKRPYGSPVCPPSSLSPLISPQPKDPPMTPMAPDPLQYLASAELQSPPSMILQQDIWPKHNPNWEQESPHCTRIPSPTGPPIPTVLANKDGHAIKDTGLMDNKPDDEAESGPHRRAEWAYGMGREHSCWVILGQNAEFVDEVVDAQQMGMPGVVASDAEMATPLRVVTFFQLMIVGLIGGSMAVFMLFMVVAVL
ncbi:hypothetical protein BD779DRAFT_1477368 [Infundibulicybe gibba]|nr:hypothetical protein BD779DRAFT_1477368 [Infundibulicybe gibba]